MLDNRRRMEPGTVVLDRFVIDARAGAGGMGTVYRAHDRASGAPVAVKVVADTAPEAARFAQEARVLGELEHASIVRYVAHGADAEGRSCLVMEWLEGEDLASRLVRGPLSIEETLELARRVAEALAHAHSRGVVHRDIKPSNVMVGKFGEIAVVDWGIAKRLDDPVSCALDVAAPPPDEPAAEHSARRPFRTRVGTLLGTPAYMSPEQARGDNHLLDERTDIFSVSVLFYELLTLQHPFDRGGSLLELLEAVRTQEPTFASEVKVPGQAGIPVELGNVIHRGLAKQREHRFQSVGEMIEELHAVADGTFAITCPATLVKGTLMAAGRFVDKHPVGVALSVVVSGGATVLGLIALGAWAIFA